MEKIYVVGVLNRKLGERMVDVESSVAEAKRLVETAGGVVVGETIQSLENLNPKTLIGSGKVAELKKLAQQKIFHSIVFDAELKPSQQKNLAEEIPAKILDRTRLILDIFARRAKSREGILQVELAQLSYMLPRMTERYGTFEQQVGGIGTRGPGERKLEVEKRVIQDRMADLRRKIEVVKEHREVARERRKAVPLPVIAIVGYTNAGKSTLLNTLVARYGDSNETTYADDKLFATLDATTRRVRLPSSRWSLWTDTVGFIQKLPTHLIAAFRSTLEEALSAEVWLIVLDATDARHPQHLKTVLDILKSLEPKNKMQTRRVFLAFNKVDALKKSDQELLLHQNLSAERADSAAEQPLLLSAKSGQGLAELLTVVEASLAQKMQECSVFVPFEKMNLLPQLYRLGQVESSEHQRRGVKLKLRLETSHLKRLKNILENL